MIDWATVSGIAIPTAVFTAGVAWGAVRQSLNGTRKAVQETRDIVAQMAHRQAGTQERVAALEAQAILFSDAMRHAMGWKVP